MTTIHTLLTIQKPYDHLQCAIYELKLDTSGCQTLLENVTTLDFSSTFKPSLKLDPAKSYVLNIFTPPTLSNQIRLKDTVFLPKPESKSLILTFKLTVQTQKNSPKKSGATIELTRKYTHL